MCIRDSAGSSGAGRLVGAVPVGLCSAELSGVALRKAATGPVSYTHLRAHETVLDLVCRLLLETKKKYPHYNLKLHPVLNSTTQPRPTIVP